MAILDIAILIIIAIMTIRGFFRGIVQEAATLIGLVVSFFIAALFYENLASLLERFVPDRTIILAVFCFILLFVISVLLFNLLGILASKAVRLTLLGWLDRTLGGFFGLVKGSVLIFFIVTILTIFYPQSAPVVENSRFFPTTLSITEKLSDLIPYKIKDDFLTKKDALKSYWEFRKQEIKKLQRLPGNG
jgi:membrane protein required for colicin V production